MDAESSDVRSNEGLVARYTNYFEIGHNAAEFILDFGQAYSSSEGRQMHTRIVTSPLYAKALLRLLEKAVERHEKMYGPIRAYVRHQSLGTQRQCKAAAIVKEDVEMV